MLSKYIYCHVLHSFSAVAIYDNGTEHAEFEHSKFVEEGRFRHDIARANYSQCNSILGSGIN